MKLLVLGGTLFLGRHVVEAALHRGDEVTIFTRGRTNPELFPKVERLLGDRDGDLTALEGREWDAVVDTSGFAPRVVRASAELLRGAVEQYTFVSSGSVYAETPPGHDERTPVGTLDDPTVEEVTFATYGPLKALCEQVVADVFGGRGLSVRAGLIVGPYDPTNRFTYWLTRIADGGKVLAPEPRDQPVQFVHGRDLADWMLEMAEERGGGVFNATGPDRPLTLGSLLEQIRAATDGDAELVWADERFLLDEGVEPWGDLPLWLAPLAEPESAGFLTADASRAVAAGLAFRPLVETIRETLDWARSGADPGVTLTDGPPAGISREREAELLAAWRRQAAA
ncbi:MAG: SDR family oxidoreductase [Actinobacteria bacterium]|nr:MAG: SDR family oxidoreductase [Actinomycetota bacterium]